MPFDKIFLQYPPLTPKVAPWMREVVKNRPLLVEMFEQYGSPVNLHHPESFTANYKAYKSALNCHHLKSTVFFARKANKCLAFAQEAKRQGFGVDTASYRELQQCLELGCDPLRLVLTAAVKNEALIRLALQHDVLIILDNRDECWLTNKIAGELGKTPHVGIRISGFYFKGEKLYSRFGFDIEKVTAFILQHLGPDKEFHNLHFKGFHFHLNGYSRNQRGEALLQTIRQADALQKEGISTSFIDIGGGFLINYLSDKKEWQTFWSELKKAVLDQRAPLTFGNDGLGYDKINGEIAGTAKVYPYYNETPKDRFLNEVLTYQKDGKTAASLLRDRNIEVRMEAGRSLLDNAGMTIASVAYRKKDQRQNWLVGLEMNRSQLFSSSADFMVDPLYIPMKTSTGAKKAVAVYFTGAYCLEQDIILKRKIVLPQLPEVGDIIAFPNTAGYMMHFYETEAHLFELATNLVAEGDSSSHFVKDENLQTKPACSY